ncbi:MAG: hypothetical protein K2P81_03265 [Bacteriovoracaceae bacterium]|nr:hypothetical protein [Bacteriovoracaceae bacterium]
MAFVSLLLIFSLHAAPSLFGTVQHAVSPGLSALGIGPHTASNQACAQCAGQGADAFVISPAIDDKARIYSANNKQTVELSIVTPERALELFNKLASNPEIPFGYAKDGCFARAHKMALLLDEEKIVSGKAFVQGRFYAQTMAGPAFWRYHVAPMVLVDNGGVLEPLILDPSMFPRPVSYNEWKGGMKKSPLSMFLAEYFTNRFSYDLPDKDAQYEDYNPAQISAMEADLVKYRSMIK